MGARGEVTAVQVHHGHDHFEYAGAAFFTARNGRLASAWVLGDLDGLRRELQVIRTC